MRFFSRLSLIVVFLGIIAMPLHASIGDGLLLYFSFDVASGDTVKDISGGGHDGVLKEGSAIVGEAKSGPGALEIEGGDETMEVASFPGLEEYQENTLLFWINFTAAASGGWDQIIAKPAPGSDRSPGLWVTPEGLSIHYRYNPGNMGPWGITPSGNQDGNFFEENTWYHVAATTKDGELVGYVDGTEVVTIAVPAEFAQGPGEGSTGGLHVGNSPAYGGPAAQFIIDELALYTRALSLDEILGIMDGDLTTAVEPESKLISTWGDLKSLY